MPRKSVKTKSQYRRSEEETLKQRNKRFERELAEKRKGEKENHDKGSGQSEMLDREMGTYRRRIV